MVVGESMLHAQRQQDVGDHHVDDEEGHEEEEADLKGLLELRHDEGGRQHEEVPLSPTLLRSAGFRSLRARL